MDFVSGDDSADTHTGSASTNDVDVTSSTAIPSAVPSSSPSASGGCGGGAAVLNPSYPASTQSSSSVPQCGKRIIY